MRVKLVREFDELADRIVKEVKCMVADEDDQMTLESEEKAKRVLVEKGFTEGDMYWMAFDEADDGNRLMNMKSSVSAKLVGELKKEV